MQSFFKMYLNQYIKFVTPLHVLYNVLLFNLKKINEGGKYGFSFILAKTVLKSIIIDTFEAFFMS